MSEEEILLQLDADESIERSMKEHGRYDGSYSKLHGKADEALVSKMVENTSANNYQYVTNRARPVFLYLIEYKCLLKVSFRL